MVDGSVSGDFNNRLSDGDFGVESPLPSFYYGYNPGCNVAFGFAAHAAFAQHTDYDADFPAISLADKTKIKSIAFRPTVAWKVNSDFAVGGSLDVISTDGSIASSLPNGGKLLHLEGDDITLGFSLGAMWQATENTRFGMQFRSKSKLTLEGTAMSDAVAAFNGDSEMALTLPETIELSVYHQLDSQWAIHGDILWTNWSRFQTLAPKLANGAPIPEELQDWDDAIRISVGATYQYSDNLKLRAGIAWDQTPVPDSTRALRNPGSDAMWYTVGASYKINERHSVDAAFAYINSEEASITDTGSTGTFSGKGDTSINVFALQWNVKF